MPLWEGTHIVIVSGMYPLYPHVHSKWLDIFNLLVGLPCWILIPQPGIEPMPPDMEVLITGPLGKFLARHFHIHTAEYKIIIKVTMGAQKSKSYFQR